MKPDILTLCILATMILANTRQVIGFLGSQTTTAAVATAVAAFAVAASPVSGIGSASVTQHHIFGDEVDAGIGGIGGGNADDTAIQPRRRLNSHQRNIYDPGDELLHALSMSPAGVDSPDYANAAYNELEVANKFDILKKLEEDLLDEQELVDKSALLMKMLEDPTLNTLPVVYVEEAFEPTLISSETNDDYPELANEIQSLVLGQGKSKRSRYYRRYPWKRHNRNRGNYEPEMRYACTPSKEDIFKLLVNLHENRKGNHSKTVNFCNRKRPAKAVFTNLRFLG